MHRISGCFSSDRCQVGVKVDGGPRLHPPRLIGQGADVYATPIIGSEVATRAAHPRSRAALGLFRLQVQQLAADPVQALSRTTNDTRARPF
jgi:hypothetical protein